MNRAEILYLVPYLGSLLLSAGVLFYAWRHRSAPGVRAYTWYALGQTLWIFGFVFELASTDLMNKIFWDGFQWLAGLIILVAFPIFTVQFTEHELKHPERMWWLSLIVPVVFVLLLMTDNLHHWIYPNPSLNASTPFPELVYDFTPVVYTYAIYSYLVLLWGISLLVRRFFRVHDLFRAQIAIIIVGFLIPILGTVLSVANMQFAPQRDGTPFTAAFGNLIIAWGLIRFRIFEIIPIARDKVVENMLDLVVVFDANDRIVDANPAALFALNRESPQVVGRHAKEVFADWPELIERFYEVENTHLETAVEAFGRKFIYEVNSTVLEDKHRKYLGRVFVSRDITERIELQIRLQKLNKELEEQVIKRTEDLLKSAERYRAVVENQTEFIVRCKLDGTRTFVNEAYCRHFGVTKEEVIGTSFFSLVEEEDREAIIEKYSRLESGAVDVETDIHRVINPDGTIGWQQWTDHAIRDETGQVIEIQAIGRDITEAKQAEIALQKSEEKHRLLFEGANDAIFIIKGDIFVDCNTKALEMFGYKREDIIGKRPQDFSPDIQPNGQTSEDMAHKNLDTTLQSGESQYFEWRYFHKDGTEFDVEVSLNLLELDNEKFVQAIVRDITERKLAEMRLAEAYDTTLEGWAKALELRDKETEDHSRRVVNQTIKLALEVGLKGDELVHLRRGAILHDIGKMAIPDEILRKPGPLTDPERKVVEQHPIRGYELLSPIKFLEKALDIPYCHHEHWDGSGYPRGLKGEEIPLAARIFSVIDVWDALLSDRPYSKAWPEQKVIEHIRAEAGKHFDPKLVEIFLALVEQGKI